MTIYGYARVSTTDQDLTIQEAELTKAGCQSVHSEKVTGTSLKEREKLNTLMEFLKKGDTLVITRFDRLARSLSDLLKIANQLKEKGVELKVLNQQFDITTSEGQLFMTMLGAFAEFETNIRKERQKEGVEKAKAEGKYKGSKPQHDRDWIVKLKKERLSHSAIAARVGCSPKTVQRVVKEAGLQDRIVQTDLEDVTGVPKQPKKISPKKKVLEADLQELAELRAKLDIIANREAAESKR